VPLVPGSGEDVARGGGGLRVMCVEVCAKEERAVGRGRAGGGGVMCFEACAKQELLGMAGVP
jgi:hypothetical protein